MTVEDVRTAFPNLCSILADSALDADIAAAVSFAHEGEESLRYALEAGPFTLNELMWLVAGSLASNLADPAGQTLESGLASIIAAVGPDVARRTYRVKLLVNNKNTLEDTRYEIAVTAKACAVLDQGSIQLEKPILDAKKRERDWKNTDVYGTYQGQPVRIEVTVLHESLPPAIHEELDRFVRAADTSSGFQITLRHTLTDKGYAERVRALVELLHESHVESNGRDVEIDGVRFEWRKGSYHCSQASSPLLSILFHGADDFKEAVTIRDIIHPCSVRNVTPKFILEDHPNPPGVVTSADLPDAPTNVPVSTKIHQMVAGKLQQCEPGVVNVIAYGNPLPMHDREVASAVLGAEVVSVSFTTDEKGVRHMGGASLQRNPKAPFAPAACLASDEDRREFVDPFRKMSAIWLIRLGSYGQSRCFPNPNASIPAPRDLMVALSDTSSSQALTEQTTEVHDAAKANADAESQDVEAVWPEMAQDFVGLCGSVEDAKLVLETLERSGLTLDRLQSTMDEFWSEGSGDKSRMRFVSPSNEQVGMQFVIDCGGYEQAKACLEEVADMLTEWWRTGFYHEAGHAVASLALWRRSGAITAQNPVGGTRKPSFAFQYDVLADLRTSARNLLIVFAAGAQVEKVVLGNQESEGFVGDFGNIKRCMQIDPNCRSHYQQQIDSDYPETKNFIVQHADAVKLIGEAALSRFVSDHPDWIDGKFSKSVILTSEEVQTLFDDYKAKYRRRWIAENAYFRWFQEGCPVGEDIRHWLEAEVEYRQTQSL